MKITKAEKDGREGLLVIDDNGNENFFSEDETGYDDALTAFNMQEKEKEKVINKMDSMGIDAPTEKVSEAFSKIQQKDADTLIVGGEEINTEDFLKELNIPKPLQKIVKSSFADILSKAQNMK